MYMDLMWYKFNTNDEKNMMLSELASSFRCNKFEDHIYKNANLNTKNVEITNEVIMRIFNVVVRNNIYQIQLNWNINQF